MTTADPIVLGPYCSRHTQGHPYCTWTGCQCACHEHADRPPPGEVIAVSLADLRLVLDEYGFNDPSWEAYEAYQRLCELVSDAER